MNDSQLHRYDYEEVEGKVTKVRSAEIYAWVAVHLASGEVDMGDIRQFDDELEPLADGWKWRRFTMTLSHNP